MIHGAGPAPQREEIVTTVELVFPAFPAAAPRVPRDHGYLLYAALCRTVPAFHGASWLAVHPLSGTPHGQALELRPGATLRLRVPSEHVGDCLPLAGARLELAGEPLSIGVPRVVPLELAPSLDARLVVIRLTAVARKSSGSIDVVELARGVRAELERQLGALHIRKPFELMGRRSLAIKGQRIMGYSVRVSDLSADESLALLSHGLGGKRAMGCGVFRPTRPPRDQSA